jgi:hypothetical protein
MRQYNAVRPLPKALALLRQVALLLLLLPATTACTHKELCLLPDEHILDNMLSFVFDYEQIWHEAYQGSADTTLYWVDQWPEDILEMAYDDLRPDPPEGVRVLYRTPGGKASVLNLDPAGGHMYFADQEYQVLLYNNDTEYILIEDDAALGTIKATTRSRTRASYLGNSLVKTDNESEETVNPPDMLYCAYFDNFRFRASKADADRMNVMLQPAVFTYAVHYRITHGLDAVALARGALSGMAREVNLTDRSTTDRAATILFDAAINAKGVVAVVRSFGIPDYEPGAGVFSRSGVKTASDRRYGLNLEVMLKNGKILTYEFDVTAQVQTQPNGGVITVGDIVIPDEAIYDGSNSGFSATVDDWGPYQDVVIDITYN